MENSTDSTLLVFGRYPSLSALIDTFAPTASTAERVVPPIWYVIGFVGNPLSAMIWFGNRMRRNNSSAIYLGALSVSDFIFLLLHLCYILHQTWGYEMYGREIGCEVFHFLFYAPQYLSTLLVLGFTAERYIAVVHPFLKETWCTVRRASIITCVLTGVSLVFASAQTYIWYYSSVLGACNHRPTATIGGNFNFVNVWTWTTDLLMFGLVPVVVLILNSLVLHEIYKLSKNGVVSRQSGGSGSTTASTVTLLLVSFYLIITQLTSTIVNCMQPAFPHGEIFMTDDQIRTDPLWTSAFSFITTRKIIEMICLSHYACYVFIYAATGQHFRREVMFLLTCYGRSSWLDKMCAKTHRGERYSMVSGSVNSRATATGTFTSNI